MRLSPTFTIFAILHTASVTAISDALPAATTQPIILAATPVAPVQNLLLDKRQEQGSCQSNHISCASLSAPEACCPSGTTCARDGAGNIACCPNNFVCTGNVGGRGGGSAAQTNSGSGPSGGSTTSMPPSSSITPAPNAGSGITVGSDLPNSYYPFPVITTAYPNAGACLSAFTFCQQQSSSCYAALAGQNGVTVSNGLGGGGVTQTGASGIPQASASQICSSLSMTACYGIQTNVCAQFGSNGGTGAVSQGHGPRETGYAGIRYMAAVGVVGAFGLVA